MDGRRIDGKLLKLLREQAGLEREQLAALIGCSAGHLKNVETAIGDRAKARHQLSAVKVYRALRALAVALGRPVALDEISPAMTDTSQDAA